jgi:MYXO-CTERM domain-containing protein
MPAAWSFAILTLALATVGRRRRRSRPR